MLASSAALAIPLLRILEGEDVIVHKLPKQCFFLAPSPRGEGGRRLGRWDHPQRRPGPAHLEHPELLDDGAGSETNVHLIDVLVLPFAKQAHGLLQRLGAMRVVGWAVAVRQLFVEDEFSHG